MSNLQQRVAKILNDGPKIQIADDTEANAVDTIFELLQKAEAELKNSQTRVDDLKWKLAKAREPG